MFIAFERVPFSRLIFVSSKKCLKLPDALHLVGEGFKFSFQI